MNTMQLTQAEIDRAWKRAQMGPEGKLIREMKLTKEDWMKSKGFELNKLKEQDEMIDYE